MTVGRRAAAVVGLAVAVGCGGGRQDASGPARKGPSAGCRAGEAATAIRAEERSIEVNGSARTYLLDAPAGPTDEPRAVVLAFHGFGAGGRRLRRWSMLGRMGHRRGVIVVFPDGSEDVEMRGRSGRGWHATVDGSPDVAFVSALLDRLERDFCVDRDRVFATGMSNGAAFTSVLGCVLADRLAGIAPVAGATIVEGCAPARPIAVQIIHGRGDRVVPVATARAARDWWVARNGCGEATEDGHCRHWSTCTGAKVSYCEAGQGHTWPRPAGRRVMGFFGTMPRVPARRTRVTGPTDPTASSPEAPRAGEGPQPGA